MSALAKYRTLLRKKLARLKIAKVVDRNKIAQVESEIENKNPNINDVSKVLNLDLSLGRLISTLELLLSEEPTQTPSQTDLERLALKSAVLEYYKSLDLPGATIVIENINQPKTIHQFAPNKSVIYSIWLRKLAELTKANDSNQYSIPKYDENVERGTVRGGAFEKMLQRYREEFVSEMIKRQIK